MHVRATCPPLHSVSPAMSRRHQPANHHRAPPWTGWLKPCPVPVLHRLRVVMGAHRTDRKSGIPVHVHGRMRGRPLHQSDVSVIHHAFCTRGIFQCRPLSTPALENASGDKCTVDGRTNALMPRAASHAAMEMKIQGSSVEQGMPRCIVPAQLWLPIAVAVAFASNNCGCGCTCPGRLNICRPTPL